MSHLKLNQQAHQAAFFERSLDMLCVIDNMGQIVMANPTLERMTGITAAELIGRSLADITDADDTVLVSRVLRERAPHEPTSFVCQLACRDRTQRWCLWTVYPHDAQYAHAVGKDITPYKEMEDKETERNIFAEALLDTVLAINSSLALEQVLDRILSNVGKVVAYDYVNIMLVEGETAVVVGVQHRESDVNLVAALDETRFLISESAYLYQVYHTRESLIVAEIDQPSVWMFAPGEARHGSFLGAPIVVEDEVIGFLSVFNAQREFFTPLHAQQLITFANQAGIAIKNARLYQQAETVAVLKERQRMAQELHDSVNQNLFAASTYADLLPRVAERKPDALNRYAADISRLIRSAVAQMRMILIELHPEALTRTDLSLLIKQLCDAFSGHTGIPVDLHARQKGMLSPDDQIAVYRITQEALHNIDKHAQATRVRVSLELTAEHLRLVIADNGQGFDGDNVPQIRFGLQGMQERAQGIDAEIMIESSLGRGTKIVVVKAFK